MREGVGDPQPDAGLQGNGKGSDRASESQTGTGVPGRARQLQSESATPVEA